MPQSHRSLFPVRLHQVHSKFLLELRIAEPLPPGPAQEVVRRLTRTGDLAHVGERAFVPLARLARVIDDLDGVPPALFIFHITRCGSTLLGRMFDSDPANRVFLEPKAFTDLLLAGDRIGDREEARALFRALVRAYGLGFEPGQQRLVVKLASYCLFHLEAIEDAFPQVPRVLLYRDPLEIMVALVQEPATWMYNDAPDMFGSLASRTPAEMARMTVEQMAGLFLELAFRKGLACAGAFTRLLDYAQLPEAGYALARDVVGAPLPPECAAVLSRHSKRPRETFTPDVERKRRAATPAMREFAVAHLYPLYESLERRRRDALAREPPPDASGGGPSF